MAEAFDRADSDLDFADALHFGATDPAVQFATFDARLIKNARRPGLTSIREP